MLRRHALTRTRSASIFRHLEQLEARRLLSLSAESFTASLDRAVITLDAGEVQRDTTLELPGVLARIDDLSTADDPTIRLDGLVTNQADASSSIVPSTAASSTASGFELDDGGTSQLGSFDIIINPGPTLAGNQDALDAFNRAADQWEAFISDPIVVTVDADLVDLGSETIIGQASSVILVSGYNDIRDQMVADADADDGILASLPTAAQFNTSLPAGFGVTGNLTANKSALKAQGVAGLDGLFGATDAFIDFNTQFAFDFDNSDGVTPGTIDFETVAAHEIGHGLGFTSIVDTIDALLDAGQTGNVSPRALDLFRFSSATDPETTSEFTNNARDLRTGGTRFFDDLDDEWGFSTGVETGDGRQASHWKDNGLTGVLIGIMDPTLASGTVVPVGIPDLRALDVIGYDILLNTNFAPTLDPIGNQTVDEGSLLTFTATANDPNPGDTLTFSLGPGAPTGASIGSSSGVFTWTPDDSFIAPISIEIIVTDDGTPTMSDSETIDVTVNNVAPTASLAGTTDIYRGEFVTFTLTAIDPSPVDQADNFTFEIDWDGDSIVDENVVGPSGSTVQHTFSDVVSTNIQVRATDKDGGTGAFDVTPYTVNPFVLRPDGGGNTDLIYGGTELLDGVFFFGNQASLIVFTQIEGLALVERFDNVGSAVTGKVIVFGYGAADVLAAEFLEGVSVEFHGGDGDDVLVGGTAGDVIFGDEGNDLVVGGDRFVDGDDTLHGGNGNDAIFGYFGADQLFGEAGEDLLIGDQFVFSNPSQGFLRIWQEWISPKPYATRIANILNGGGLNDPYTLVPGVTIIDDGAADTLTGGSGDLDWFFYTFGQDLAADPEVGETETDADP